MKHVLTMSHGQENGQNHEKYGYYIAFVYIFTDFVLIINANKTTFY